MNTLDQADEKRLREAVLGLVKECPVKNRNPDDCILHAVRQMSAKDRLCWLNALSADELAFLAAYHQVCMETKMEMEMIQLCDSLAHPG